MAKVKLFLGFMQIFLEIYFNRRMVEPSPLKRGLGIVRRRNDPLFPIQDKQSARDAIPRLVILALG
jgi:hypothetical protein